ncbi:DUF4393 domain-containing protein [Deinococcus taklimakanensis]|uniref:DUF4393 domain-containing protein n=1 Tax=Deinococcus taklimakanensis TaxID=536443 RepID=A0ABW5P627_9DEIO
MTDSNESPTSAAAQAVAQLVKEVPVYQDAVQPAAQQLGRGLGGLLAYMMLPLQKLGIKAEVNIAQFKKEYEDKLIEIPNDKLIPPDPIIMGPALQALTYTVQEPLLRKMFVNLLAAASNADSSDKAHPSFVEIIKQLKPVEAKLVDIFRDEVRLPMLTISRADKNGGMTAVQYTLIEAALAGDSLLDYSVELDNLERLKIINIKTDSSFTNENKYDKIVSALLQIFPHLVKYEYEVYRNFQEGEFRGVYRLGIIEITKFGQDFISACCAPEDDTLNS